MTTGKLKGFLANLGLILASLLAAALLLEAVLHFTPYRRLLLRERDLRYYYQFDPTRGYDIRPNVPKMPTSVDMSVDYDIWSNELGCFDEPYRGEPDFILLVGDSFTLCTPPSRTNGAPACKDSLTTGSSRRESAATALNRSY